MLWRRTNSLRGAKQSCPDRERLAPHVRPLYDRLASGARQVESGHAAQTGRSKMSLYMYQLAYTPEVVGRPDEAAGKSN